VTAAETELPPQPLDDLPGLDTRREEASFSGQPDEVIRALPALGLDVGDVRPELGIGEMILQRHVFPFGQCLGRDQCGIQQFRAG